MAPLPTQRNAQDLKPDILRNEMVERIDQMDRVEAGGDGRYASGMSLFPLVNIDDPDEEWYTINGVRDSMAPVSFSAESPLGTLDMPSKESLNVQSYKKKYRPDKGAQTEFSDTPFSVYARAAQVLRDEIFLTRERVTWLGDEYVQGLTGQYGRTVHPEITGEGHSHVAATSWSDAAAGTPWQDLTYAGYNVMDNGRFIGDGGVQPTILTSPSVLRDVKQSEDMRNRLPGDQYGAVTTGDVEEVVGEDISGIQQVLVYLPRKNAAGQYIDEDGTVVDDPDDAAYDNVLEPYDPATGTTTRNVIVGRPGAGSAFVPWFLDRLLERSAQAPDNSAVSVDAANGFFTQLWNENDPLTTNFKAAQEIGFHVQYGTNWYVIRDV